MASREKNRRVLFLQCMNAGQYPPIMNAAAVLANRQWAVTILSSPGADTSQLAVDHHPRIKHLKTPLRPRNAVKPADFAIYCAAATALAVRLQPDVIYASDMLSALPSLMAARLTGARLIYHEHDTPDGACLKPSLARWRAAIANRAELVILPNAERGRLVQEELGFAPERLRIVWNTPRLAELPPHLPVSGQDLIAYYHGTIAPGALPDPVIDALGSFNGRIRLRVVGYEAPSAPGYIERLLQRGRRSGETALVEYMGQVSRERLLETAAKAHLGFALTPMKSGDVNKRHAVGASVKAFDYMAAGLPLLVSDQEDWREMFVAPGFAIACDPAEPNSIVTALSWFLDNPDQCRAMAARNRAKIERDWNYDSAFAPVVDVLEEIRV